jgi:hypothetical protein
LVAGRKVFPTKGTVLPESNGFHEVVAKRVSLPKVSVIWFGAMPGSFDFDVFRHQPSNQPWPKT